MNNFDFGGVKIDLDQLGHALVTERDDGKEILLSYGRQAAEKGADVYGVGLEGENVATVEDTGSFFEGMCDEMRERLDMLKLTNKKTLTDYNREHEKLPRIVILISGRPEEVVSVSTLVRLGRCAGINVFIEAQDDLPGQIRHNLPVKVIGDTINIGIEEIEFTPPAN